MIKNLKRICLISIIAIMTIMISTANVYAASKLSAPTNVKASISGTKNAKVKWSKVKNAKKYTIYRATSKKGKYKKIGTTKSTSYTDKKTTRGKTYYYKVVANASNSKLNSKKSKYAKVKIPTKAKKVLKVGNYTLKYGIYKGKDSQYSGGKLLTASITLAIKQDGTYTRKSSNTSVWPNLSGTYKVKKSLYGYSDVLELSSGGFYVVTSNNTLQLPAGSGATFTYKGTK